MAPSKATAAADDVEAFDGEFEDDIAVATGSSFPKMEDLMGCLLLMRPYETGTRPSTAPNAKPGDEYTWVECDVVVLEAPQDGWNVREGGTDAFFEGESAPFELEGFQFTGQQVTSFLIQKMKRGKRGLGVLVEGKRTRGRNAPWVLETPTPEQIDLAKRYARAAAAKASASSPWE